MIVPYDPAWPDEFETERRRLATALGEQALRIEHHGSTSVPGLAAKPVIDIQVSVAELHPIERYAPALASIGYTHFTHPDDEFAPFFHKPAEWPHTHHVHVVRAGGANERETLAFRDYLRNHPDVAREYEALKTMLAALHTADSHDARDAYAHAKGDFITKVTKRALESRSAAHMP